MPAQPPRPLLSLLGYVYWGDFAELTMYRSKRGRLIVYKKSYPDKPPSPAQLADRANFAAAAQHWNALSDAERSAWTAAAQKTSLCMTGYNLYVWYHVTGDTSELETLQRQTGQTLLI